MVHRCDMRTCTMEDVSLPDCLNLNQELIK
jgi:hypothetical protein